MVPISQWLQNAATSAGIAVLATYLTAWWALRRYRQERAWDRKASAYTVIFEALYDMGTWVEEHRDALSHGHDIFPDQQIEMNNQYNHAKRSLERRLMGEIWLLSSNSKDLLMTFLDDLKQMNQPDFISTIDDVEVFIDRCVNDLRESVETELLVNKTISWRDFWRL